MADEPQQPIQEDNHVSIDIRRQHLTRQLNELGLGTVEGMRQVVNQIARRLLSGGHSLSHDDADDAAAYAIDQVWEHYLNKGRNVVNFPALLYTVALRKAVKDKREHKTQIGTLVGMDDLSTLSVPAPNELDMVLVRDLVHSILSNLSGIDRDIMLMVIQGHSPQDIAESLPQLEQYAGLTMTARYIRVRLHRIRNRIHQP